LIKWCRRSRQT